MSLKTCTFLSAAGVPSQWSIYGRVIQLFICCVRDAYRNVAREGGGGGGGKNEIFQKFKGTSNVFLTFQRSRWQELS